MLTRRRFLRNGLWVPFAPAILRAADALSLRDPSYGALLGAPAESGYTAYASVFDGSNDYMTRGVDLTGNADGKKGTFSCWFKLTGGDSTTQRIFCTQNQQLVIWRHAANQFKIYSANLFIETVATFIVTGSWVHICACWDVSTPGARHIYVNGLDDTVENTFTDANIDYTDSNHAIGAEVAGTNKFYGELCEVYLNLSEYLNDPTKFASGGKPISLGATGSTPTGTAPIIYFRDPYDSFETNRGTGGDFTVTGALTQGTPP